MLPRIPIVATVALALVLSACSGYSRHRDPASFSSPPVNYGSGLQTIRPGGSSAGKGTLVVRVVDATGRPLRGATVKARVGKRTRAEVSTDAQGLARFELDPGTYVMVVAGCGETVIVDRAQDAVALVRAGKTDTGALRVEVWRRRYKPTNSVEMSTAPPWDIGEHVRVGVRIEDGCEFDAAPGVLLAGYAWTSSSNLAVAGGFPKRADSRGFAAVAVTCRARGDAHLVIYDTRNVNDRIDLLLAGQGPPAGHSSCE